MNLVVLGTKSERLVHLSNALDKINIRPAVSQNPITWKHADALIYSGFGRCEQVFADIKEPRALKLLLESAGIPFLAIGCGMNILMNECECCSREGLGMVKGVVKPLLGNPKEPYIGMLKVAVIRSSPIFEGLDEFDGYFMYRSVCVPARRSDASALSSNDRPFVSALWKDNVFGTHFYPERSGDAGLRVLQNFVNYIRT